MTLEFPPRGRRIAIGFLAVGIPILVISWVWLTRTPQIGEDKEVVKSVDALFTAVTSRNEKWLGQSEERLHTLRDCGRLPQGASDYLDRIIHVAREGNWRDAAKQLFGFIKSQRALK